MSLRPEQHLDWPSLSYLTQQWSTVSLLTVAGLAQGPEPLEAVGLLMSAAATPATTVEGEQTLAGGQPLLLLAGLLV